MATDFATVESAFTVKDDEGNVLATFDTQDEADEYAADLNLRGNLAELITDRTSFQSSVDAIVDFIVENEAELVAVLGGSDFEPAPAE